MTALAAEWTKLRSVRSTTWSLVALAGLTVLFSGLVGGGAETTPCDPSQKGPCTGDDDVVEISLAGVYVGQMAVAALGVMAAGSEYATGLIRTTFTAEPRRRLVLAAKAVAVAGVVLAVGFATTVAAYLLGRSLLDGNGYTAANGYPQAAVAELVRPLVGTSLYLTAVALIGIGLAVVMRHTAAAITTLLGLLWLPILAPELLPDGAADRVLQASPMTAGLAVQRTVARPDSVPIDPWVGLGVTWLYATVALGAAFWLIRRRDA
jgi:ABC-2 type transport system permease protein